MKSPNNTPAPRAQRDQEPAALTRISKEDVMRIFAEQPDKVITYRQLSRRLGITTKGQREEVFTHLRELRSSDILTLAQNDEYKLTNPLLVELATNAARGRKTPKNDASAPARSSSRPPEADFGQDPIVHRRRSAGFDYVGDDRPERNAHRDTIIGTVDLATPNFAFVVPETDTGEGDIRVFTDQLKFAMQGDVVRVRLRGQRDGRPTGDVTEVLKRQRAELVGRLTVQGGIGFVKSDNRKIYFDVFVPPPTWARPATAIRCW